MADETLVKVSANFLNESRPGAPEVDVRASSKIAETIGRLDDSEDAASKADQTITDLTRWIDDVKSSRLGAQITVTLQFETDIPVWGALAEQVVDDLLNVFALDAGARQFNSYAAVDESEIEYWIAFSDDYLLVHIDNAPFDANFVSLVEAFDTMCRAVRAPQDPSMAGVTWLSSAQYRGYEFNIEGRTIPTRKTTRTGLYINSVLSTVLVNDFQDQCWQPLFKSCFVVDEYRLSVSSKALGKGLEMSFDLMTVLAGAEYIVPFEKSVILVGYQTVLFPTSIKEDYAQFHLLVDKEKQINPFQQDYGQLVLVEDLSLFRKRRCFVGWCDVAQINLGTRDMLQHEVTYSTANERARSLVMTGISVGTQATSIAPLQVGANVAVNFGFVYHHITFPPNFIFSKLLNDTAQQTVLIFDTATRQSWLVPKLSLLLHMAHVWFLRRTGGATNIAADRIPFATPHESADSLKILLQGQGQVVVCGQRDDEFHLRTLMIGLSHNLLAAVRDVKQSKSGKLFGFEFMDIVTEPARGGIMRSVKVTSGHAWLELANAADAVVFCANLGEAIKPKEDTERRRNNTCNSLPSARDFLAAHISCLLHIAIQAGVSQAAPVGAGLDEFVQKMLLADPGVQLHHAYSLNLVGDPFGVCNHQPDDPNSCWSRRNVIQSLVQGGFRGVVSAIGVSPRPLPPPTLSNTGAVVFGL
ncbi:hypothetical protein SEUCBS140593_010166 [Sporothrix eucalyptigena]|uniref:Uncharacterized protein n=1 Tax=Sporothrix eucalyptigena TaxID=1812306 RepID=A0ABP0D1E2_9PEZI